MKKHHFKLKASFLSVLLIIQVLLIAMSIVFTNIIIASLTKSNQEKTQSIANYVQNQLEQNTKVSVLAAVSTANNPALAKSFAQKNRVNLKSQVDQIWKDLEPHGLSQFSFFLPTKEGIISFYKAHQPENFGELISKTRIMVQKCNEDKKLVAGLEQGKSGYGFRAVTPIYLDGKYLGCIEFGSKFSEGFLKKLNDFQPSKWSIINLDHSLKSGADKLVAVASLNQNKDLTLTQAEALSTDILKQVQSDQFYFQNNKTEETVSLYIPVKNFNNQVSLYIKSEFQTDYFQKTKTALFSSILICIIGLLVSGFIIFLLYKEITIPISGLVVETEKIRNFQLNEPITISSRLNEVDNLVTAVANMKTGLLSFQKYVPSQLVRQLVKSGLEAKISGQKKLLTILFSDIADFTTISEKLSPTELTEQLSEYLNAVTNIIIEEQGTVDKYIGDAVMAFWGAPLDMQDHAARACKAALRAQEKIKQMNEVWTQGGKATFYTRIGVNTGEVVVGNIGSDQRLSYTVIGDSVNLASRIEGVNKSYKTNILITESTYELVQNQFEVRAVDFVTVKGKSKAVKIFELICEKNQATAPMKEFNTQFTKAVDVFFAGQHSQAEKLFLDLQKLRQNDYITALYLKKCTEPAQQDKKT
jgi:class 3 adenylate cyclase